jgi:hypothetical protein
MSLGNTIGAAVICFALPACASTASGVPAPTCDHRTYAYADRVVVFSCDKQGAPELHVIVLDDQKALSVTGRVSASSSRVFDTAGHFKDYVMLIRWDQFDVYDLSDAAHPRLATTFVLKKHGTFEGYNRIEQHAENKFLVATSLGAVEVTAEGEPAKWALTEVPISDDLAKKRWQVPSTFQYVDQNLSRVVLKETPRFRYELVWKEKTAPGEIWHRQYVCKLEADTGKPVSELLVGEHLETID